MFDGMILKVRAPPCRTWSLRTIGSQVKNVVEFACLWIVGGAGVAGETPLGDVNSTAYRGIKPAKAASRAATSLGWTNKDGWNFEQPEKKETIGPSVV